MTLLDIINTVADEIGVKVDNQIVGSNDTTTRQLLAFANRAGKDIRSEYEWPRLQKEHLITLIANDDVYSLPLDMDRFLFQTEWNRDQYWRLIGPTSPQRWQEIKSGILESVISQRFRVKGVKFAYVPGELYIDPVPSLADNGDIIVFEYQSKEWIFPITWDDGLARPAGSYCSWDSRIYYTVAGGICGTVPPTHTSGTVSDGGVDWLYAPLQTYDGAYQIFREDTDVPLIDRDVLELSIHWRYLRQKGLDWQPIYSEYLDLLKRRTSAFKGAKFLSMSKRRDYGLYLNVPETGYGV